MTGSDGDVYDRLAPAPRAEQGRGATGCLLALPVFVAGLYSMGHLVMFAADWRSLLIALLATCAGSAYAMYRPTTARTRRVRRRRVRRLAKRKPMGVIASTLTEVTVMLETDGAASSAAPADSPEHEAMWAEIVSARTAYALSLEGPRFSLIAESAALSLEVAELARCLDRMTRVTGWLARQPDPRAAWLVALALGQTEDVRLATRVLIELNRHAPAAPMTARVFETMLAHPSSRLRLAAARAVSDRATLEQLAYSGAVMAELDADDITGLLETFVPLIAGDPAARARLLAHPDQVMRLALVVTSAPHLADDEIIGLAGDPARPVRALAFESGCRRAPGVALEAARQVVQARRSQRGAHPYILRALERSSVAAADPVPSALAHLGRFGGIRDLRLIAAWLDDAAHRRAAQQARARMHDRLGDGIELGQLSLAVSDDAGGGLSVHGDGPEGALSTPDAQGDPNAGA